ncbi:MAG: rhodanese-like domain-containing protein [Elusimicrobiota bacterium]
MRQKNLCSKITLTLLFSFSTFIFFPNSIYSEPSPAQKENNTEIISLQKLNELQQDLRRNYILLDVDPEVSYSREHIDGAINLPLEEIELKHKSLPKNKLLIVYCHCGGDGTKAKNAVEKLKTLKFKKVAYLGVPQSAYYEYKKSGNPTAVKLTNYIDLNSFGYLQTAAGAPIADFLSTNGSFEQSKLLSIVPAALNTRIKNQPDKNARNFTIIDLREKEEYLAGHIPYAQNIPLGKLFSKNTEGKYVFDTLPKDKDIILYCFGGKHRCQIASQELHKAGYRHNVYYLEGGFSSWKEKGYEINTTTPWQK